MSDEPTTPQERAVFIVRRIESAMRDFAGMHPPDARGERIPARYRHLGGRAWQIISAHDAPVPVCDWSLDFEPQRMAGAQLAEAMSLYVEGGVGLAEVKTAYQAFAAAHLVWRVGGRIVYDETAARLAVMEELNERIRVGKKTTDTATVARLKTFSVSERSRV